MGWNGVRPVPGLSAEAGRLLQGVAPDAPFYFVHSYYPEPEPDLVIATTSYGRGFASVYGRPGLWAAQFHPEKSGEAGLRLLANFAAYCREQEEAR